MDLQLLIERLLTSNLFLCVSQGGKIDLTLYFLTMLIVDWAQKNIRLY